MCAHNKQLRNLNALFFAVTAATFHVLVSYSMKVVRVNVSAMILYHIQALLRQIKTMQDQAKNDFQVFLSTVFVVH
jgi:hypothetical protein